MMQPNTCEACGQKVEFRREGSTQGLFCTNCDWALVTTYIPQIELDETLYSVRISGTDLHDKNHIRAVSAVTGLNFIAARKLLQQDRPLVFEGKAPKVLEVRDTLASAGLSYLITPRFDY